MRRMTILLPLMAMLGACVDSSEAARSKTFREATAGLSLRPEAQQCLANLGATHANFTPLPDRYFGAGCSTLNAVQLSSLRSDSKSLGLSNIGPVSCPLANTFAAWARFGADRAARQILGSPLVRIETMGSYSCRNVAGTARRSAHATANAIDVSGFVLADGRRITVLNDWYGGTEAERQFLRVVHESANAAHRDHLHVEPGGRSYCR
jgi:hypothetical protein